MKLQIYHLVAISLILAAGAAIGVNSVDADHSWGSYHWARESNPFALKLGDNMSDAWDPYLKRASEDWSISSVLDTTIVAGGNLFNPKNCKPKAGRIEVCNARYGNNGWLGLAQIWASGSHITQATAKMNDTYFNTVTYNTPAWRRLVVCQEIAHDFGLDHQDEVFNNANLGTCMDYTNDPDGGAGGKVENDPSNEYPNAHDYEELGIIYAHLDSFTTIGQTIAKGKSSGASAPADSEDPGEWGKEIRKSSDGRNSLFERDLGGGRKIFTFVIWAK